MMAETHTRTNDVDYVFVSHTLSKSKDLEKMVLQNKSVPAIQWNVICDASYDIIF